MQGSPQGTAKKARRDSDRLRLVEKVQESFLLDLKGDAFPSLEAVFDFALSLDAQNPLQAFVEPLQVELVGPFEILAGKEVTMPSCWWRFHYDPPEMVTVMREVKDKEKENLGGRQNAPSSSSSSSSLPSPPPSSLHWTLWRDAPDVPPQAVMSSDPQEGPRVTVVAADLLGALASRARQIMKEGGEGQKKGGGAKGKKGGKGQKQSSEKGKEAGDSPSAALASTFLSQLSDFCQRRNLTFEEGESPEWKNRKKTLVVQQDISGVGVVVPYDKTTEVGHRDLGHSPASLKKLMNDGRKSFAKTQDLSDLDDLVSSADIANDECDFGCGLWLGRSLFLSLDPSDLWPHASGSKEEDKKFVRAVSNAAANQLNVAYQLLGREAFGPVATETLKLRLGDGHLAGSPLAPPAPAP
uniref:Uncharacterized protein n=1 Tax=Chromera velia CCMP2878 TaxID=1169474 RepID=A0A0G4GHW9_9ALVE|eukprot:Cvel_666.t1-p1 / transcript=Cvel_666.t1 / gene=Cvel_666 / organism=Chromera_velia_CCMP2878 / gene_product=UPF0609 protein C4orf27 homolog, putative / transcript_product=UPF0609 protein C4orf27 homolog, putative / location=Cvel_scaffold20:161718-164345(+) / protein_length=410 / sequence_SO=supercontig / SO=protein_coding / is_pseudo=false